MCAAQGSSNDFDDEFYSRILKVTQNRVVPFWGSLRKGQVGIDLAFSVPPLIAFPLGRLVIKVRKWN